MWEFYALAIASMVGAATTSGWPLAAVAIAAIGAACVARRDDARASLERMRQHAEAARHGKEREEMNRRLEQLVEEIKALEDSVKKLKLAVNLREVTAQSMKG